MSLAQAIDALIEFVENHHKTPDYGQRLEEEFFPLDMAVYVEARRLGLQDADLPRKDASPPHDDATVYFGRTNVPGFWDKRQIVRRR